MATESTVDELSPLLADLVRHGITLEAHGERLRYHPKDAVTPDLLARMKTHKSALLALCQDGDPCDKTPSPADPIAPNEPESGVLSLLSLSHTKQEAIWSQEELALLDRAKLSEKDMKHVEDVKAAFADCGAHVVAVVPRRPQIRKRAAHLLRCARWADQVFDRSRAPALREQWHERVAICTVDAGLDIVEAEAIALNQMKKTLAFTTSM